MGAEIRDGYGQTETTAQIGNSPGQPVKAGSMGRPLPGYDIVLLDPEGRVSATKGKSVCASRIGRSASPTATRMMTRRLPHAMRDGYYHTGDIASRDSDGYFTFVGRADDVFKASDYRLSPFELESVLIEHPAVAEAAVVPSPDPLRQRRAEGIRDAGGRLQSLTRARIRDPRALPKQARGLQTDSADRVCIAAEDDFGKNQAHRAPADGGRTACRGRTRPARILRRRPVAAHANLTFSPHSATRAFERRRW